MGVGLLKNMQDKQSTHLREDVSYRHSLVAEQLLEEMKEGKFFGDIEWRKKLRNIFNHNVSSLQEHFCSQETYW